MLAGPGESTENRLRAQVALAALQLATLSDPDLEPAGDETDRLGRKRLSEPWLNLLTQYDAAASAVRSAQRRHLAQGWRKLEDVGHDRRRHTRAGIDE